ncbi:hypothetical protein JCM19992_23660 [Thermostilla marina]
MYSALPAVGFLLIAVQAGWQPAETGGVEYILQIEPDLLQDLAEGATVAESDFPPELVGKIVRYRITVGTTPPPRIAPPDQPEPPQVATPEASTSSPEEAPPATLPEIPQGRRLEAVPAVFAESETPGGPSTSPSDASATPQTSSTETRQTGVSLSSSDTKPRPWLPLTLAISGMVAAVAGMLYTGWLAVEYRRKYLSLLRETLTGDQTPQPA